MKKARLYKQILSAIHHFLLFFLPAAFLITCTLSLFVTVMTRTLDITLTEADISMAAKLTFANILVISIIFTVIDTVRRRLTVDRPVKEITEAARRITEGDFSVRIPPLTTPFTEEKFNEIIACFNKMAEELAGIETLQTDFIANVSHELKTPLSVMQNYGTLLQAPDLTEAERLAYAKAITESSRRLAHLITNILRLNKLENQQILPTPADYDLSAQLCDCLLHFEAAWEAKGLNIEADIEENILAHGDAEMMSLVWNNLISNAIKFTEPGGTVEVAVKATTDGPATVRVRDTGCGISPEVGRHMFEKFYQGDTSHATEGNGLGLALVKRVIAITGCDISVQSEPGVGTVFTVTVPFARQTTDGKRQTTIGGNVS